MYCNVQPSGICSEDVRQVFGTICFPLTNNFFKLFSVFCLISLMVLISSNCLAFLAPSILIVGPIALVCEGTFWEDRFLHVPFSKSQCFFILHSLAELSSSNHDFKSNHNFLHQLTDSDLSIGWIHNFEGKSLLLPIWQ